MKIFGNILFISLTLIFVEALHDDANVPTTGQMVAWHGYSAEEHEVTTADNYTLSVFRLMGTSDEKCLRRNAVILAHGLLCSSTDWIIAGPDNALAYLLVDHGYDVWLMNFRGNTYSRKHMNLTAQNEEFWNFSWHEMGMHDVPSVVDHVLAAGGAERVAVVCHSVGCTSLLVALSQRPEYNRKIESAHMMAPVSLVNHTRSILNSTKGAINTLEDGYAIFGGKDVNSTLIQKMWSDLCLREKIHPTICSLPIFLITGWHSDSREYSPTLWEAVQHQKGGLSSKTLIHLIQIAKAGVFQAFDYSEEENILFYGHKSPPTYNLGNVSVPVNIYYSENDAIADLQDVNWLASSLPTVMGMHTVSESVNQHLDFLWGKEIRNDIYDKVIENLNAHVYHRNFQCRRTRGDGANKRMDNLHLSLDYITAQDPKTFKEFPKECKEPKTNPTELMRETLGEYGYPLEYHVFTTEDGYVIGAHRIPSNRTYEHLHKPYPVILVHGALMSSFSWLVMGPKKSLGYILADAGFDVWMINHRGSSTSKIHTTIPECSDEFWNFRKDMMRSTIGVGNLFHSERSLSVSTSTKRKITGYNWHEMGKYDLPAMIDYVLATTKMKKADLIGFSLGANIMFVMGSKRPEYNGKVNVMHVIAPSIVMTEIGTNWKIFAHILSSDTLRSMIIGDSNQMGVPATTKMVLANVCKYPILYQLCTSFAFTLYGLHEEKHDEEQLSLYLKHIPDGSSMKTMSHLAQILLSGRFHEFDLYENNFEVYGQENPPEYNLSAITAKVRIYYSDVDEAVSVSGLLQFASKLPSVIGLHERKHFRHQDYLFPMEEHVVPYDEIIRNMKADR